MIKISYFGGAQSKNNSGEEISEVGGGGGRSRRAASDRRKLQSGRGLGKQENKMKTLERREERWGGGEMG